MPAHRKWPAHSILLMASLSLLGCTSRSPSDTMLLSGTVEMDTVDAGSLNAGRIATVEADEGDRIKPGQVLVRFEEERAKAELAEAEAMIKELSSNLEKLQHGSRQEEIARTRAETARTEARLDMLRAGSRPQEVESAKAEHLGAQSDRQDAANELKRSEKLFQEKTVSEEIVDRARARHETALQKEAALKAKWELLQAGARTEEVKMAESEVAAAKANLALAEQGPRQEDIATAQAAVEGAKARFRKAQEQVRETIVTSPIHGLVQTLDLHPGDMVSAGRAVARLLRLGTARVIVYVPEDRIGQVRIGQQVELRTDSFPDKLFAGSVRRMADEAEFTPRNVQTPEERAGLVFAVRVDITDPEGLIRSGMSADVIFPVQPAPGPAPR